jgi:hypothetical protein
MKSSASFAAGWKLTWPMAVLALAVSAGVTQAAGNEDWGTIQLANVGDEPGASGVATLTNVSLTDWSAYDGGSGWPGAPFQFTEQYTGVLSVTCLGLWPGATYSTPAGSFQAARRMGAGKVKAKVTFVLWRYCVPGEYSVISPFEVTASRLSPDGSSTTVLMGDLYPPGY